MTERAFRPRRSCLYMPGANARALDKARSLPADVLILDLEDAVAPEAKAEARERVVDAVRAKVFGHREVVIRVNGPATPWGEEDLAAAISAGPDAILLPKVETAAAVATVDQALTAQGADSAPALWAMIETPYAIMNLREIGAAAASTRLRAFVTGTNDLAKDMRVEPDPRRECFAYALSAIVTAARAYDLVAIDGVFNGIGDDDGLAAECAQGRLLGFDGKSLIHPGQLETANAAFAPEAAALEQARAIVAAFAQPENAGKGVISMAGRMVERLHLEQARRLVAMAEAIAAVDGA